jgi:hypothetical protein
MPGSLQHLRAAAQWLKGKRQAIGIVVIGHAANQALSLPFDYVLYPAVLLWLGPLHGGIVMAALSAAVCYLLLRFYLWSGRDWLGIEVVRALREGPPPRGRLLRFTRSILRAGRLPALVLLSVKFDPFITVLYLRAGVAPGGRLDKTDWTVFWTSVLISNVYWIGAWSILLEGIKAVLPWIVD